MNIKRIIKQVLKEQHEKGTYVEIFNEDVDHLVAAQMDRIAKVAIEDTYIEDYLVKEAEDCIRTHLIRIDYCMKDETVATPKPDTE